MGISELTEKLGASTNLYLTDISGLDAKATSNLRRACYKANISLSMTKNTFLDKAMQAFRKKSEKPVLKGAYIEQNVYIGDDQLEALVNIKSREELIGDIISLLQSPAKNVVSALQ